MSTVDYVPLANGAGADVESQAQYLIDLGVGGSLEDGYKTGTALSAQVNKTFRQATVVSSALANAVSQALAADVLDDGNVAALTAQILAAIAALSFTTGDLKPTMKTVADSGWVLCNDGTIGSATSGATTRANADCQALFLLLWTNVTNTYAPVVTGRGVSAAADWAANKQITLPAMRGRALGIYGTGAGGLSARVLGQTVGEENHALTSGENGTHQHTGGSTGAQSASHTHSGTTGADSNTHTHAGTTGNENQSHGHTFTVYAESDPIGNGPFPYGVTGDGGVDGTPTTDAENTAHDHTFATGANSVNHQHDFATGNQSVGHTHTNDTTNSGLGTAHNTMQPTSFINMMIKL